MRSRESRISLRTLSFPLVVIRDMEESRVETGGDEKSLDLSDRPAKEIEPGTPLTGKGKRRSALPAFICLSVLLISVVGCLIAFTQQAEPALWELQGGDIYEVKREQTSQTEGLDQGRRLGAMDDPSVLVSSIFVLASNYNEVDLVVFMGQIDSVKSQGIFSLFSGDDDEERDKRRGKTLPLVRVLAEAKSGRIKRIQAPFRADKLMVQIAENIASDLLLNRDPQVYLPLSQHKVSSGAGEKTCQYPEVRGGQELCPEFEVGNTVNETVYTKVFSTAGAGRRLDASASSFNARQSAYVNKHTGRLDKTCTIGNLTVELVSGGPEPQNLLIQQASATRFTLVAKALSKSDISLFQYLIERRLEMVDITSTFYEKKDRELATTGLTSVPIFNLLGFKVRLETELRALPQALNVTVSLVADGIARVVLASGLIGGDVVTAVKKVQSLSGFAQLTVNETLALLGTYSGTGVDVWKQALGTANAGIWTELNKLSAGSPDFLASVNASLQLTNQTIQQVITNYTTTIRKEITFYTTQLNSLNDSLVANSTQVAGLNQTLYTYIFQADEIYSRIQDMLGRQSDSRLQQESLRTLIAATRASIIGKPGWVNFNTSLWEYQGNLTAWRDLTREIEGKLGALAVELQKDGERYNAILGTQVVALQDQVNTQLVPLYEKYNELVNQQSSLIGEYGAYNDTIQSILPVLAQLEDSLAQATTDTDREMLRMQKTDLLAEIAADQAEMDNIQVKLDLVDADITNQKALIDAVLQVYQSLGYSEASHQKETLGSNLAIVGQLAEDVVPQLMAAIAADMLVMSRTQASNMTLDEEKDWINSEMAALNSTLQALSSLQVALRSLCSGVSSSLAEVTSLTATYPSGYFSTADTLITTLTVWKSSTFSRLSYVQSLLVTSLAPIQARLEGSNATAVMLFSGIPDQIAGTEAVDIARATYVLQIYQAQYNSLIIYSEVTIPEILEDLYKRLTGINQWITIANTTLIEAINNKTIGNPLVPELQTKLQNLTIILESIQNHTFVWRNVFNHSSFLNLSALFQMQGSNNQSNCNVTEIQREMNEAKDKIQADVLGNSKTLAEQTSAFASAFVNIDSVQSVTVTVATGGFLNFTHISAALGDLWKSFNRVDQLLWSVESELQRNVTSMLSYVNTTQTTTLDSSALNAILTTISSLESLYSVSFIYPVNVTYSPIDPVILNQTSVLLSTFTVAPLILLYEQQFSASLSLIQSVVLNCSLYINTYISQYTAPMVIVTENSVESSLVLGPLCTPLGCVAMAATMAIVVDGQVGISYDNDGFYAIFSPLTRCSFDGVGLLTFAGTRIQVDLHALSPISPRYRIGVHKQARGYFIEGQVSTSFEASLQLLKTRYSKVVDLGCWCVRDGKAQRRLCLTWQTLYFKQPLLLLKLSYRAGQSTTVIANQTIDMA